MFCVLLGSTNIFSSPDAVRCSHVGCVLMDVLWMCASNSVMPGATDCCWSAANGEKIAEDFNTRVSCGMLRVRSGSNMR